MTGRSDAEARKQAERDVYNRAVPVDRPHYYEYWNQSLLKRLEGREYEPEFDAMAARYLTGKTVAILGASAEDVEVVARFTDRIVAINISERELDGIKRTRPATKCLCADIEQLKLDEQVDVAFCAAILHHLHPIEDVLDRILGIVKPDGILFIAREPSLLNPFAALGRIIAPTAEHTPGERPFVFRRLRRQLRARTEPCEEHVYFLFSMMLPYLGNRLPARGRALLDALIVPSLALESALRRTGLFDDLFWILRGAYRKPCPT